MTRQEMFNRATAHLVRQGKRSVNDSGRCLYRGPNGLKCAIGIFLPDPLADLYDDQAIDGDAPQMREVLASAGLHSPDLSEFAVHLQQAHDDSVNADIVELDVPFGRNLASVADRFDLDPIGYLKRSEGDQ